MSALRSVISLAASQHGVVSVEQARAAGLSRSTFVDVVHREGWRRLQYGVYLLPGAKPGLRPSAQAALLAAGPNSVLCRRTAAHLLGLGPPPPVIEVFLPLSERTRGWPGVRAYRTRTLLAVDITEVDGLRTTTGPRTAIDLAAVIEPPQLRATLIDGRQRGLMRHSAIETRLSSVGPLRGIGTLRRLLAELHPEHCDSVLESLIRRAIKAAGVERPAPDPWPVTVRGRTVHVDIAWPDRRVGVEVDGFAYHSSRSALDNDHRRSNRLTLAGWRLLRVGWGRLDDDVDGFIDELRTLLG